MLKYVCAAVCFLAGILAISSSIATASLATCYLSAATGSFGHFGDCLTTNPHNCVAYRYPDTCTDGNSNQDCVNSGTEPSYEYMQCALDDGIYSCVEGLNDPIQAGSQVHKVTTECGG